MGEANGIARRLTGTGRPVIAVRGLTKRFGRQIVFENLDLDVYEREILGLVGASGQGKSVLLRCIVGLLPYEAGTIQVFGGANGTKNDHGRADVQQNFGILFQDGALFSALTVLQNIQVPMREHLKLPQRLMDELAMVKLQMVGLKPADAYKFPSELSGGMRKRAGLARALALDPAIVFLDEPTSGLDPIGAAAFDELILTLRQTLGLTVCMVTHDLDSLFRVCDRVAVLADRHIVRTGPPLSLVAEPGHPWIAEYFCGPRARAVVEPEKTAQFAAAERS